MILGLTKQDILNLTNESKRKGILADWKNWGIWHKAPEIGLYVYRLDLPDGSFFTASWYDGDDFFPGGGTHNVNRPRYNFGGAGGQKLFLERQFLLNLSMKLWEKLQDRAIINYRVEQRIRKMRKMRRPLKVEQENKNERY